MLLSMTSDAVNGLSISLHCIACTIGLQSHNGISLTQTVQAPDELLPSLMTKLPVQLLAEACDSICEHLYDFVTNRYATHVARRLLCIVAGRNVLPLAAKSQNKV